MISSRTCSARSMSSYPIAHKCSDCVIVVLLFSKLAASARGALSRLLGPVKLMQGQFLCQASREVEFCRKALSKKDHQLRGSAEGTALCQRGRAQGLPGASRLAPTMAPHIYHAYVRARPIRLPISPGPPPGSSG